MLAVDGRPIQEFSLFPGRLVVGRAPENEIPVDSKFVSRHHCQIITSANGSLIEDLNSTNGIYLQGKRVRRHELNDGDVIALGKHELVYIDQRHGANSDGIDPTSTAVFETDEAL